MLRNYDRLLLSCGQNSPYICRDSYAPSMLDEMENLFRKRIEHLNWFYLTVIDLPLISDLNTLAGNYYMLRPEITRDPRMRLQERNYNRILDADGLLDQFVYVNNACNQELLRVHTSGDHSMGTLHDICFKVCSVRYNWFSKIMGVVAANLDWVETVTIETDRQSRGDPPVIFQREGLVFDHMPAAQFMDLRKDPVVMKKLLARPLGTRDPRIRGLAEGKTIFESFPGTRESMKKVNTAIERLKKDTREFW